MTSNFGDVFPLFRGIILKVWEVWFWTTSSGPGGFVGNASSQAEPAALWVAQTAASSQPQVILVHAEVWEPLL